MSDKTCICGHSYTGKNCAHYLSNWMIEDLRLTDLKTCSGITARCEAGRPIRANDMPQAVFERLLGLKGHDTPPGYSVYIHCWNDNGQGHVYFGNSPSHCERGTQAGQGFSHFLYYY